jgi:hypothetical protein
MRSEFLGGRCRRAEDFPMFHLDGRPYAFAERQVPRSLTSGEEIVDEEFFGPAVDGSRVR